jgi:hypothetical protein
MEPDRFSFWISHISATAGKLPVSPAGYAMAAGMTVKAHLVVGVAKAA